LTALAARADGKAAAGTGFTGNDMGRSGDVYPSVTRIGRKIGRWEGNIPGCNLTLNGKDLERTVWLFIVLREFTLFVEEAQLVEVEVTACHLVEAGKAS